MALLAQGAPQADATEALTAGGFSVTRFEVSGPNPLPAATTAALLEPFLGEQATLDDIRRAAEGLESAVRDRGFAFYRVLIPPQTIEDGKVELEVVAFPVTRITVSGNVHHSEANVLRAVPGLAVGESPNTHALSRSLLIANLHPTKKTELLFSSEPDTGLEARVLAQDRRPMQGFVWLNNTGSDETGETRLGLAARHVNLFDRDHVASLSFTTSPEQTDDVAQYAASYQIPFYRAGGLLNAYAVRSDVDTGTVAQIFEVSGRGDFLGAQYTHALRRAGGLRHYVIVGVDDKLFDNQIDFEDEDIGVDVRSRPLAVRYTGDWSGMRAIASFYAGLFVNIESGAHNDDASYTANRVGASPDWVLGRAGGSVRYPVRRWELLGRFDVQYSDEPLIPGEQFGLGGLDSVRGLDERAVTGDRALFLSAELRTPALGARGPRLVSFVEGGSVRNFDTQPGEVRRDSVASVGAGLRWAWRDRLSARLDYGYVVDGADPDSLSGVEDGDDKLHFNVVLSF